MSTSETTFAVVSQTRLWLLCRVFNGEVRPWWALDLTWSSRKTTKSTRFSVNLVFLVGVRPRLTCAIEREVEPTRGIERESEKMVRTHPFQMKNSLPAHFTLN